MRILPPYVYYSQPQAHHHILKNHLNDFNNQNKPEKYRCHQNETQRNQKKHLNIPITLFIKNDTKNKLIPKATLIFVITPLPPGDR